MLSPEQPAGAVTLQQGCVFWQLCWRIIGVWRSWPITSCPGPKPPGLSYLRQVWGAERKIFKQIFFGENLEILPEHCSCSTMLPRQMQAWAVAASTAPGTA